MAKIEKCFIVIDLKSIAKEAPTIFEYDVVYKSDTTTFRYRTKEINCDGGMLKLDLDLDLEMSSYFLVGRVTVKNMSPKFINPIPVSQLSQEKDKRTKIEIK